MVTAAGNREGVEPARSALLDALGERWEALAARAAGRVYELPEVGVEEAVRSEDARGARYDTIVSFMRTTRVCDLDGFVASLERILAPDGWILMLEPSGSGSRGLRVWPSRARRESDVVSALRAGGFTVTDLHRREFRDRAARPNPTGRRRYVEIRARRETAVEP